MQRGFVLTVLLIAAQADAITWSFDQEGDTQGWIARDSSHSGWVIGSPLRAEVVDGIWRVYLPPAEEGRLPALELISPLLRHDSALFDQLRLRFRTVHPAPLQGSFYFVWTNASNRDHPGGILYDNPDSLVSG